MMWIWKVSFLSHFACSPDPELRASRDEWLKTGAQAKLEQCRPKARPCVRVNEGAGVFGTASDYRVLLGY